MCDCTINEDITSNLSIDAFIDTEEGLYNQDKHRCIDTPVLRIELCYNGRVISKTMISIEHLKWAIEEV